MPTPTVRDRLVRWVALESDTRAGRLYNLVVFGAILLSVVGRQVRPHSAGVQAAALHG